MPYYTRVLSRRSDCPHVDDLSAVLQDKFPNVALRLDDGERDAWRSLVLAHADGPEIAVIERNPVEAGSLGSDELAEFVEEVAECRPTSAATWLASFLPSVSTIYAFQHLSGTGQNRGDEALRAVSHHIWARGDAILQADGEGFTNEDGYHILWQFSEHVTGTWWMAVREDGRWERFEMDLGSTEHREAFLAGRIPSDARRG
jgi:hypothetical protein